MDSEKRQMQRDRRKRYYDKNREAILARRALKYQRDRVKIKAAYAAKKAAGR